MRRCRAETWGNLGAQLCLGPGSPQTPLKPADEGPTPSSAHTGPLLYI